MELGAHYLEERESNVELARKTPFGSFRRRVYGTQRRSRSEPLSGKAALVYAKGRKKKTRTEKKRKKQQSDLEFEHFKTDANDDVLHVPA